MDRYKETFETWNKVAKLYQDKFMDLDLYNDTYKYFCDLINKDNASVLDLGCGPGNILKQINTINPTYKLSGIDVAPNMIELAKTNLSKSVFEVLDVRQLNQHPFKYNAIIAGFVIPYLTEAESFKLIENCKNQLLSKGKLYLSFVDGQISQSGYISGSTGDRMYFNYHSTQSIKAELKKQNFSILKIVGVDYPKGNDIEIHTIIMAEIN